MTSLVHRPLPASLASGAAPTGGSPVGTPIELPGPRSVTLVPVHRDGHAVGAYVVCDGVVRYRPVVDLEQILSAALAAVAITALAAGLAAARRRGPAIGAVTMGPGGWVSLKGVAAPTLRPSRADRPWWARLLRARRLMVDR
jgi:hypothetical protein